MKKLRVRAVPSFVARMKNGKMSLKNAYKRMTKSCCLPWEKVKYEVLSHLNKRKDIEIVKLETRHMKKREKGTGLKATVRKRRQLLT